MKDLIIWTQYEIQVASYNGAGLGAFSRPVTEYTLQGGEQTWPGSPLSSHSFLRGCAVWQPHLRAWEMNGHFSQMWSTAWSREHLQISNAWAKPSLCSISVVEKAGSEVKNYLVLLTLVMTCCHACRSESAAAEGINRNADESWGPEEWVCGTCDRPGLRLLCQES